MELWTELKIYVVAKVEENNIKYASKTFYQSWKYAIKHGCEKKYQQSQNNKQQSH